MSQSRKVLRVGTLTRPHTLDPLTSRDSVSSLVLAQIFETPFTLGKSGEPSRPRLFDGPLRQDGGGSEPVYSAALQKGILFSDGTPLTLAHVVESLSRVEALRDQARIDAQGDRVVFRLKSPNPRFDLALTMVHAAVALNKGGELLGTGPYKPAPNSTLEAVRLVKNPHYRRPAPIEEIEFRIYPPDQDDRPSGLLRAVESGEVDFTSMLSRTDVSPLQGVRKIFQPSNSTAMLHFNSTRPALKDARVRRALSLAINRPALTELSYTNVLAFTATSLLPPMMGISMDRHPFNLDKARKLLAEAAGGKLDKLELLITWAPRPYLPNPHPVASLIVKQLAELGVEAAITTPRDSADYFRRQEKGEYDLILGGWIADTPDPADFMESNLASDRIPAVGKRGVASCNLSRLQEPSLDAAVEQFRADPTEVNRNRVLDLVAEQAPLLPLMYGPTVIVTSWRVLNVEVSPLGVPDFATFDIQM